MHYKKYTLEKKGWSNYVIVLDKYSKVIVATPTLNDAKSWVDKLEGRYVCTKHYQAQS